MNKRGSHWLIALATVTLCTSVVGCRKSPDERGAGGGGRGAPVPVTAATANTKDVPVVIRAIGNVRASATVSVKPRVGGLIASVEFREGQDVKSGDVLFTIDPKPFEVALAQARAALAQLREQAANAQQQAERYSTLGTTGSVAKEQLDQIRSNARASSSAAEAAEAKVKETEIQLSYCTIKSPISGRTGRRMIDAGNVVTANVTELVVVNQVAPVDVVFAVPEPHLGEINRYRQERKLAVVATADGLQTEGADGELTFVDNTVKQASGTVDVKASFPNEDLSLWPGRFVDVGLTVTIQPDAIVVPAPAVQTGQKGQYVFVVKADKTVEMRSVEMSRTFNNEAVIAKGLAVGESVVVDGHIRLVPGAKVDLKPPVGGESVPVEHAPSPESIRPVAVQP